MPSPVPRPRLCQVSSQLGDRAPFRACPAPWPGHEPEYDGYVHASLRSASQVAMPAMNQRCKTAVIAVDPATDKAGTQLLRAQYPVGVPRQPFWLRRPLPVHFTYGQRPGTIPAMLHAYMPGRCRQRPKCHPQPLGHVYAKFRLSWVTGRHSVLAYPPGPGTSLNTMVMSMQVCARLARLPCPP
jgi:hypothetical protein